MVFLICYKDLAAIHFINEKINIEKQFLDAVFVHLHRIECSQFTVIDSILKRKKHVEIIQARFIQQPAM